MKQHKGKIASVAGGAAVITAIVLLTPSNEPEPLTEALRDSALVHAVELAAEFEGLRLDPYHDQAGFATVGYGHLLSATPNAPLSEFESVSEAQAESLLTVDMQAAFICLQTHVTEPLNWHETAALADFIFNEGCGHFERSTLLKELNAGNKHDVPPPATSLGYCRW